MKKSLLVPIFLLFAGCDNVLPTGAGQEVTVQRNSEETPPVVEPCPNGNTYPFDKCGKDQQKPLPLEGFPRSIPKLSGYASLTDLSGAESPDEILAGEWIGAPFLESRRDGSRLYLKFSKDHTFRASCFKNSENDDKTIAQLFETISGTYSVKNGWLLLTLSEGDATFFGIYFGHTWFDGDLQQVNIPVGLHEGGKTLTLHESAGGFWIADIFVKKEL